MEMFIISWKTGTNGLSGLGIEPMVGRWKPEAVFFFGSFLLDEQKKWTIQHKDLHVRDCGDEAARPEGKWRIERNEIVILICYIIIPTNEFARKSSFR